MIKKSFFILIAPILIHLLVGCCDCPDATSFSYTNCDLALSALDNSGEEPMISTSLEVDKDAFGIRLHVSRSQDVCHHQRSFSIIPSAYALSCNCGPESIYNSLDAIDHFEILTSTDFDDEHPAGSDVSDRFFDFRSGSYHESSELFERIVQEETYQLQEDWTGDLLLLEGPSAPGDYSFTIKIMFIDGRVIEAGTETVALL